MFIDFPECNLSLVDRYLRLDRASIASNSGTNIASSSYFVIAVRFDWITQHPNLYLD